MSILDERDEYLKNPYFKEHEYGDFTPFYVAVALCSVLGGFLFILNIAFCWCSRHRQYWQNRNTGETENSSVALPISFILENLIVHSAKFCIPRVSTEFRQARGVRSNVGCLFNEIVEKFKEILGIE